MRSKIIIGTMIFSWIAFLNAFAQERRLEGEVSVTGVAPKIEGGKAKFNEYRDIRDGAYVEIETRYHADQYYLDFRAQDIGYKTQRYGIEGGKWGSFKYHFDYDEIPHNFTYGAKSFYTGVGGAKLTFPTQPPSKDINTWTTFDYSIERKNYGGGFKLDMLKPFYFDASVNREERKGLYPVGAAGTSSGGIAIELPAPINYMTDNLKLEAGYIQNPFFFSLGYFYSTFRNDNSQLDFRNPANGSTAATTDIFTLPPNNTYYRLDLKGGVKLPFRSKFNLDLASSSTQSDVNLLSSYVALGGRNFINLSSPVFNGKVDTQSYNFMLTSNPFRPLDAKLFYKYYERRNKSNSITTTDGPNTFSNPLFDYRNQKYGAELGFKLPASFNLTAAYTHARIERRDRDNIPTNTDDTYGADLRWSGLDFMVAKVGYERLQRKGDFGQPADPNLLEHYVRRYDVASRDRNTYKAIVDFFPIENLNFSLGYKYKDTNYNETILGLQSDKRSEFTMDGDYLIAKRVRLFAYFDFAYVKLDQFQRTVTSANNPPSPLPADPGNPPTITPAPQSLQAFNWKVTQTETNYGYGLGADLYILPQKLTLKLQHNWTKSDGYADYTYFRAFNPAIIPTDAGRTQDNIDISNWGKYETRFYMARLTYNLTKTLSFAGGYVYEKFIADDAQYNGYNYTIGGNFLTGAYTNPSYEANIAFLSAAYRF